MNRKRTRPRACSGPLRGHGGWKTGRPASLAMRLNQVKAPFVTLAFGLGLRLADGPPGAVWLAVAQDRSAYRRRRCRSPANWGIDEGPDTAPSGSAHDTGPDWLLALLPFFWYFFRLGALAFFFLFNPGAFRPGFPKVAREFQRPLGGK